MQLTQKFISYSFIVVLILLLAGCATKDVEKVAVDNGPVLDVYGRISIKQFGKPVIIGNYTWNRGKGFYGWNESFNFIDQNSLPIFKLNSDDRGNTVSFLNETRSITNLNALIKKQLGIDLELKQLAKWISNEHLGKAMPDKFIHNNIRIEVLKRDSSELPMLIRMIQDDSTVAISIRRELL